MYILPLFPISFIILLTSCSHAKFKEIVPEVEHLIEVQLYGTEICGEEKIVEESGEEK